MPRTKSPAVERRLQTSSDLSVPSAGTQLLLSESLINAAASIQRALLMHENDGPAGKPARGRRRRAKRRGKRPVVIELKVR